MARNQEEKEITLYREFRRVIGGKLPKNIQKKHFIQEMLFLFVN
jgi:hypothetical protein